MTISRRGFGLALGGFCGCAGQASAQLFPAVTPSSASLPLTGASRRQARGRRFIGCGLTAAGQSEIDQIELYGTSGNARIDAMFTQEINAFMLPIFQIAPFCCFYNDGDSPNAFATPMQLAGGGDGTVAFGVGLMSSLVQKFSGRWGSSGTHAAGAIFAHEFGHIVQFAVGMPAVPGKARELHADFMAGWYTQVRNMQQNNTGVNFEEIAQQMYDIGDFAFTSESHHGTPDERVSAYMAGAQFGWNSGGANVHQALDFGRRPLGI